MSERMLDVGDGALAWEEAGKGAPIILLHGFSFDRAMWDPQIESLASSHRVIRYDLRGFGKSTRPRGSYSHADDLAALITALDLRSPILVGLSLGANVALEFAVRWPGIARGLVLASPGLAEHVWAEERPPAAAARIAAEQGVAAARAFWLGNPIYATLRRTSAYQMLEDMVANYDGWHWQNADPRLPGPNITAALPSVETPALILSGAEDARDYRAIADRLARTLPAGCLERFEGVGHLINLQCPAVFNDAVLNFAGRLAPALKNLPDG